MIIQFLSLPTEPKIWMKIQQKCLVNKRLRELFCLVFVLVLFCFAVISQFKGKKTKEGVEYLGNMKRNFLFLVENCICLWARHFQNPSPKTVFVTLLINKFIKGFSNNLKYDKNKF